MYECLVVGLSLYVLHFKLQNMGSSFLLISIIEKKKKQRILN